MNAQEMTTTQLSPDEILSSIGDIMHLLLLWGHDIVVVTYGWACKLPMDQLWQPHEIQTQSLASLIRRSVNDGIFHLGGSDLHIEDRAGTFEFKLCHESDIHFKSVDQSQVAQVIEEWTRISRKCF